MSAQAEAVRKFTKFGFFKTYVLPAFLLFLIPIISLCFFRHVQSDMDHRLFEQIRQKIEGDSKLTAEQRSKSLEFFQKMPVSRILASSDPGLDGIRSGVSPHARFYYSVFRWVIRLSLIGIISGALVFIVAGLSVLFSLRSQIAQYYSLSAGWHVLRIFSTAQVLIQGCLAVALSYWVTAYFSERYYPKLIIVAAVLAGCAAFAVIAAIFKKLDGKFELAGVMLEREPDSPLWSDLERICAKVGTPPPDRIIAGIDNNFFVTEHPVTLEGRILEGRTLYVSLSLLKTLQGGQADAVMAHEMAHFSGNDTLYSRKISPLLGRYHAYLQALYAGGISLPVFYFMLCFHSLFQLSLGKLSREREFRADKIASEVASPQDMANALLKISAYGNYRGKVEHELFDMEKAHDSLNISQRVCNGFRDFACSFVKDGKANESETAHPFDSHPPFEERLKAVNVRLSVEDMLNVLQADVDARWYRNIRQAEALEQNQWKAYEDKFREFHEQALAYRYLPETDAEKEIVLRHFPEVTIPGRKKGAVTFTYDKFSYSEWPDPILFKEITKCTSENSALGHPRLRIEFMREKSAKRIFQLDVFQAGHQEVLDVFGKYYSRHLAMTEYRKDKKQEQAADPEKSVETGSE